MKSKDNKIYSEIRAEIKGVNYIPHLTGKLEEINIKSLNINASPTCCIVNTNKNLFALSRWVSPKRTRSYPFERVYNTLGYSKKITVIPIIKDEGEKGDRDFIQWDTISLMSLLDVYVILAYYDEAEINKRLKGKITNQRFNNRYVKSKIKEISNYHSSALHWNLNEIKTNLSSIVSKVKKSYVKISKATNVSMHSEKGLDKFKKDIAENVNEFMNVSRRKAREAQGREMLTKQPKESLATLSKAKITIKNYLGGYYYLTTDEIAVKRRTLYLIEGKHSKNQLLPSISDIKDGLLKMILYCNLSSVFYRGLLYKHIPVLSLTSLLLEGSVSSNENKEKIDRFTEQNEFSSNQKILIGTLFKEAKKNKFIVTLKNMK